MAIDIGPEAINRGSSRLATRTLICLDNPANASGTLTDAEVWMQTTTTGCTLATFSGGGGAGVYTPRDTVALGGITAGTKATFSGLSLTVVAGDYLGCYCVDGKHENDPNGFAGVLSYIGDGTGGAQTYTLDAGEAISIKATGSEPADTGGGSIVTGRESLYHPDKNVVERYTFNSFVDLAKKGVSVIGDPTLSNGVATLDGSDAFNIDQLLNKLKSTTVGTWSARVMLPDATPVAASNVIGFGDTDANEYIFLYVNTDGTLSGYCVKAGSGQWKLNTTASAFSDGVYAHIALVQDGTEPVFYVNGVAVAQTFSTTNNKTTWFNDCTGLDNGRIGCYNFNSGGNTTFLTGDIDMVEFRDVALTASECLALANNRLYVPPSIDGEVLNVDTRRGSIYDKWGNALTNTAVEVVRDGEIYAGNYNGSANLEFGNLADLDFNATDNFTVTAWVKPTTLDGNHGILTKRDGANGWELAIDSSGYISWYIKENANAEGDTADTDVLSINRYYHVGYTFDRDSNEIRRYLNGKLTGTVDTFNSVGTLTNTVNVMIGDRVSGTFTFKGNMPVVKAFKGRIFSAEEMAREYNSQKSQYNL